MRECATPGCRNAAVATNGVRLVDTICDHCKATQERGNVMNITTQTKEDIASALENWRKASEGDSGDAEYDAASDMAELLAHILHASLNDEEA